MAHDTTADSASRRLEKSRRALMQNMMRNRSGSSLPPEAANNGVDTEAASGSAGPYASTAEAAAAAGASSDGVTGLWRTLRRTAKAWWRSHPAHMALEVGEPLLEKYAAANPLKLLAISAALGGALVLARPWRLISVTGLLIAAMRSTQVSDLLASLLSNDVRDPDRAGRHYP